MDNKPLSNCFSIARELLRLAEKDANINGLSPYQLIKMCYVANGWSLALLNRPLFNEVIEAWEKGPTIPALFYQIKEYGSNNIPSDVLDCYEDVKSDEAIELLDGVFSEYKDCSSSDWFVMTRAKNSPWEKVYSDLSSGDDIIISNEDIKNYYMEML